jgi:hypothetical protein
MDEDDASEPHGYTGAVLVSAAEGVVDDHTGQAEPDTASRWLYAEVLCIYPAVEVECSIGCLRISLSTGGTT